MTNTVVICIKWISHYRKRFYELLRSDLAARGIQLRVICGEPTSHDDRTKRDWVALEWTTKIRNTQIGPFLWQPALKALESPKLVIVEQASRLLLNYVLHASRVYRAMKLAYWGHGRNFQARAPNGLGESLKRWLACKADWWFAYNELSARHLEEIGFPRERITDVENTIDTKELAAMAGSLSQQDIGAFKEQLGISNARIGIYCGGLYADKRLDMLIAAASRVKEKIPEFSLIIAGGGPEGPAIRAIAKHKRWIHYLGPTFDRDKVVALKSADVYLNAGLVGLGILDAFACGLPVIVTNFRYNSPEIAYLTDGINGRISEDNTESLSRHIVTYLSNRSMQEQLAVGARTTAERFTIENMVGNFSKGISLCLAANPLRS